MSTYSQGHRNGGGHRLPRRPDKSAIEAATAVLYLALLGLAVFLIGHFSQ